MRCLSFLAVLLISSSAALAQTVVDPSLRVVNYAKGFDNPTGVVFLDRNATALVTEKQTGKVKLVSNRKVTKTVLDLPVANDSERGLLSIALSPTFASDHFVYLYHTASTVDGGAAISNKISRYTWDSTKQTLVFDRKIIDLAALPGPNHDGGKIAFAPNGKLFAVVGDVNNETKTQNFESSKSAIGYSSMIIRLQPNGQRVSGNPFQTGNAKRSVQDDVWAYGIRNSFGIAFDPITGDLWDTENGADRMDEINRVTPGFNSGWKDIMGPKSRNGGSTGTLFSMGSRANYQDPKLSWLNPIAPTDLEFMSTSKLGTQYNNDFFMGDVNTGTIYHMDLNSTRKSLALSGALADGVADNSSDTPLAESAGLIFGTGFGVTTDIVAGPGGLFVLSLNGSLYRISPSAPGAQFNARSMSVPEPSAALVMTSLVALIQWRGRPARAQERSATPIRR